MNVQAGGGLFAMTFRKDKVRGLKPCLHERFVGPMCRPSTWLPSTPDKLKMGLHDRRSINDHWLSDGASSSDLHIGWRGTDRRCCGD